MFNRAGFNSLQFNQSISEFEVNRQDTLEVGLIEEPKQQAEINSFDEININITEAQILIVDWQVADSWPLYFVEGIDIYVETSGTDPPLVSLDEHATVQITASDDLNLSFDLEIPLGFNQQRFNQPRDYQIIQTEKTSIGVITSDNLSVVIEDIQDSIETSVSDVLFVYIDQSRRIYKEVFISDDLGFGLIEQANVVSSFEVNDDLVVNLEEQSSAGIHVEDNLTVTIDKIRTKITGTLAYLIDGKFHMITKGYVKVNHQFRPIIKEYAVVNGEWKIRKN